MAGNEWDAASVELLKRLYAEGKSAALIAQEMPFVCSRNAIIGKVHRLKLPRRGPNGNKMIERISPRKRVESNEGCKLMPSQSGAVALYAPPRKRLPPKLPRAKSVPVAASAPVSILDLLPHHCRYIVVDADSVSLARYCGGLRETSGPYCPGHAEICASPIERRRA